MGCSSGAAKGTANVACGGTNQNVMCLRSCSLGCGGTGCAVTEIAQNENIVLIFSADVDPLWANSSTIRFRTATGDEPVGRYLVHGSIVEFVPDLLVIGGQTFFGFRGGDTYTMTLPGGSNEINAVRSTAGDPLKQTVSCTLNVSRGIIDLNGVPPSARLISPTQTTNVPQDVVIQLEFNELIDVTPFLGATGANGPVVFAVRRTQEVNGQRECRLNSAPVPLGGSPRVDQDATRSVSTVTFRPTSLLPGTVCVEITVTDRVRDLSGKPALPQVFQFMTVPTSSVQREIVEEFVDDTNLDRNASAGTWANGRGVFGTVGSDGRHGTFDVTLGRFDGVINGRRTYTFDTSNTIIPGSNTLSGNAVAVTDGKFFFDEMIVPSDVRLRFTGNTPPQFSVRGRLELGSGNVGAVVELQGEDTPWFVPPAGSTPGQAGGRGAIFAGSGGNGGDKCGGFGASPAFSGRNGGDCRVLGGHAFAGQVVGTGGHGSPLFPATGLNANLVFPTGFTISYCNQATSGGGGGGLFTAGGTGLVVSNNIPDPVTGVPPRLDFMGPPSPGGNAFPLLPVPAGTRSSLHFLVGGSGGGGGGGEATFCLNLAISWSPGNGGGGGGGAIALRAGDVLRIGDRVQILAKGGSCGASPTTAVSTPQAAPAGGGSGGTVLLQAGRIADILGLIDVRGGTKGILSRNSPPVTPPTGGTVVVHGGDGSPGLVRLEVPGNPLPSLLPNVLPPATANNVAPLTEVDDLTGFRSVFRSTDQAFGPEFVRYEIRAVVDGQSVLFSDDPAVGTPARFGQAPIEAWFQGGTMDLVTGQVDPVSIAPWRQTVGSFGANTSLADDALNGFRFLVLFDRTIGQQVEIESVKVIYRI